MWYEMSWDRMPGTGTEVPTIGEFLAGNPVPHLVPHSLSLGFTWQWNETFWVSRPHCQVPKDENGRGNHL